MSSSSLPVVVIGAGPCGLVAALTLQKHGIPFVIIEKATRSKICSNAGSGFELAPTAIEILRNRMEIQTSKLMLEYGGCHIQTVGGETLNDANIETPYASVNRADMQNLLLDTLFPSSDLEEGVLKCGVALESYKEDAINGQVTVHLSDNSTLVGCAVLGCDGIHSKVRKCMHDIEDPLHFCNCVAYWAKCPIPPASDLEKELNRTQNYTNIGPSFVFGVGTSDKPGSLFAVPFNGNAIWAVFFPSEDQPTDTNDLTRRGGGVLTESKKQELVNKFESEGYSLLFQKILEQTKASDITEAGLFDREKNDLSYSSSGKLVAILGDAAHPQSPFLGQGVNMAITDAFVLANRIAMAIKTGEKAPVPKAISAFDSSLRRDEAKKIVETARLYNNYSMSSNRFTCWMMKTVLQILPFSWLINDVVKFDNSNKNFLQSLDDEYPELQQERGTW